MNGDQFIKKAYESIFNNDFEQAIEWFEQAVALDPNNAAYHYKLSITCARSNKLVKALKHAQLAAELAMEQKEYTYHLQHLQALDLIQKAKKTLKHHPQKLINAVNLLKQAIAFDSLATDAYMMLALAYAGLKRYEEAILSAKEAIRLDPNHETAKLFLMQYEKK